MAKVTSNNRARLVDGGRINRDAPLPFTFNGQSLTGYQGDSLASALLANEVKVVARSFKYHRPRGIFTAGEEEPCALVELGEGARREPTCRAPMVPLTAGLVANSQNCWPSVNFDAGRVLDFTHIFWPAGFYNKTFNGRVGTPGKDSPGGHHEIEIKHGISTGTGTKGQAGSPCS